MAAANTVDLEEFAVALHVTEKDPAKRATKISQRIIGLGHGETCTRCGGGGEYSFNQMYGTVCFRCHGAGQLVPKPTKKLLAAIKADVEAGKLDAYFENLRRKAEARKLAESAEKDLSDFTYALEKADVEAGRAIDYDWTKANFHPELGLPHFEPHDTLARIWSVPTSKVRKAVKDQADLVRKLGAKKSGTPEGAARLTAECLAEAEKLAAMLAEAKVECARLRDLAHKFLDEREAQNG